MINKTDILDEGLRKENRFFLAVKRSPLFGSILSLSFTLLLLNALSTNSNAADNIPIQIGDWYLEPTIEITFGRAESEFTADRIQTSDSYAEINPKIAIRNENREREIYFGYELDAVKFNKFSDGDYDSSILDGEYRQSISNSSDISIAGEYEKTSVTNGLRSELQAVRPVSESFQVNRTSKELVLQYEFYGERLERAGHLFDVSLTKGEWEYEAEEVDVVGRDVDYATLRARWRYLWSQGNGVFANFETTDYDYETGLSEFGAELDNQQTELILGFEWRARQNISGEIGVGVVHKKFDKLDIEVEVPTFYGELEILPSAVDTIEIQAQKKPLQQAGFGAFQDYRALEISWLRRLSPRWSFEAYVGAGDIEYEQSSREDDFYRYGLIFEYRVNRVSDIIFGYRYYNDDSNEEQFDYNGSNLFITYSTGL